MDWVFCGVLSYLVLSHFWKHGTFRWRKKAVITSVVITPTNSQPVDEPDTEEDQDIELLKKQGYSDELISIIIPTINNK